MTRTQQADSAEEVRHVPLYIYFDSSLMDLSGID